MDLGIAGISDAVQVGQGAFGTVYRARQDAIGRTVAVKVLGAAVLDEEQGRRFERECQALGALSGHPNIVAVYDSGWSSEQRPYLIMDYLPGGTLAEGLARDGTLSWQVACDIGVKLAGALAAAHEAGVLHRDVKPDNVLMSAYDEPQLVDFGIARLVGGSQTRTGQSSFTLAHAAPEVLNGQPASETSDVYSLASTLYELLAGHAPHVRSTDESFHPFFQRVHTEEPPDLSLMGVPAEVRGPLSAGLVKDPAQRTATARALAVALQDAQRTLGAAVTTLVGAPSETAASTEAPGVIAAARQALTIAGGRRRSVQAPTGTGAPVASRRRWLAVIAAVAAVAVLGVVGAVALTSGGEDRIDTAQSTTGTTTASANPEEKQSASSSGGSASKKARRSGDAGGSTPSAGTPASPSAAPGSGTHGSPAPSSPSTPKGSTGTRKSSSGSKSTSGGKSSGAKSSDPPAALPPPAVTPPALSPPPPSPPSLPSAAAEATDGSPCGAPTSKPWSPVPVQPCPLVGALSGLVPVYRPPVSRSAGSSGPAALGSLRGLDGHFFVCQRRFPGAAYVHPRGWRNNWWAVTKSDDNRWGWVSEAFFKGGEDNEPDGGLAACPANR